MLSFILHYSFRNLFRHKRRSILTIGTVALSALVTIVGFEYADAVLMVWKEGAIDYGAGHVQIHRRAFYDQPDSLSLDILMDNQNPILHEIKSRRDVAGIAKRLLFEGIISFGRKTMYFQGRGIDPDTEIVVSPGIFAQGLKSGHFIDANAPSAIAIGKGLAEALEIKVGDEVTLMTNTLGGSVNGIDVIVQGIIDYPVPTVSKRLLYMNLSAVQQALATGERFSEIAIRLSPGVDPELWLTNLARQSKIKENSGHFDLKGWWEIEPLIRKVEEIWHSIMGVIMLLLFSTAGLSVLNIIYLLVAERLVEIGTLMSLGAKPKTVHLLFATEATLIGIGGSLAGALVANAVLGILGAFGVPFDSPFASGSLVIFPKPNALLSLVVFCLGIAICTLAALLPARKAARVTPLTAFRGQLT